MVARLGAGLGGSVLLAAFLAVALFPVYWMVVTALRPKAVTMVWPPEILPRPDALTLDTFATLFSATPALQWTMNTAVISVLSTVATVFVSTLAGYALSRGRNPTTTFLGYAVLIAKMLPGTLLVVPFYVMFHRAGLLGTPFAVVLANLAFAVPFATWMMKGFFDAVPVAIEEAAILDGASPFRALRDVVLPLAAPGIAAVALYTFIVAWNDFLYARTFMPGGANTTLTVGATQFLSETEMEWNRVMAISLFAVLPVVCVFAWLQRHFVSGLTRGYN